MSYILSYINLTPHAYFNFANFAPRLTLSNHLLTGSFRIIVFFFLTQRQSSLVISFYILSVKGKEVVLFSFFHNSVLLQCYFPPQKIYLLM